MRNMRNANPCFIKTTSEEVAEHLRKAGYQEIGSGSQSLFCFLNDRNITFSHEYEKDITYTNELFG